MTSLRDSVLQLLAEGLNKTEVGEKLGLSRHQVRRLVIKDHDTTPDVKWGQGAAKLVSSKKDELVVFGSDFHFPYQDNTAIESFLWMVQSLQPDRVVLNGDIADFFQLSRFNTGLARIDHLQNEIDQANYFRTLVRQKAPNAVIDETEGNHDSRIKSYVEKNARSLQSLRALQPEALFRYKDLEINWHPGCGFLLRPEFLVKHGTIVRGEAGATAKAELALAGISGISGHTHRLARYRKVGYVQREWLEQGCLCRLDPDYIAGGLPNWSQGCAVGEFSRGSFVIHEVPFTGGRLRFGKESY